MPTMSAHEAAAQVVMPRLSRDAMVNALNSLSEDEAADMALDYWRGNGNGLRFWFDIAAERAGLPVRWDLSDTLAKKCGFSLEHASAAFVATSSDVTAR